MTARRLRLLLCCAALACGAAQAHDTWFAPVEGSGKLALVTGTRFPVGDLATDPSSIVRSGCAPQGGACWAELRAFDITLPDKLVEVYLREVKPDPAVRQRWASLHGRGLAWQESYRKFARIELAPQDTSGAQFQALRAPQGLDLEIVATGAQPFAVGQRAGFRVLARGEPVAGQPVELVSERNPLGLWSRTDADGRVEWPLPFDGAWLVRTVLIEPEGETQWHSRFATFGFRAR